MEIENLTKEIRDYAFDKAKKKTPEQVATSWYNEDLKYSGVGKTLFMILPTPGCSWALGDSGGCSMCSYVSDCTLEPIESNLIVDIFKEQLSKYPLDEVYEDGEKIAIKLFASGSFLNPHELPIKARDEILKILSEMDVIDEIVVESRPEYVKEDVLEDIFSIIGDKLFEISIGLETSNDDTRLNKINKGFTLKDFEESISIISKLKNKHNIKSKAYVFVKPILLNEKEAIEEAIETALYCEKIGVDRLSFCPATIHGATLIERLWRRGSYEPPWIWSTIEIINTVRQNINIPTLLDTSGFGSRRGPYNCKKCNKELKHLIIESNLKQNIIDFDCECKANWEADVNHSNMNYSKTFTKHIPLY
ncbi:archaeosine biosynthesis radical SAM protein RaSEA [Methanobrevibacter sp. OttesenSCG-928-K11]|nr:archaeosine biosynthesis radical SAM protein RaSEA [Methanobrevibacter sp. OttesenSCG-928-K11]MDL2271062.1 archaeosine biosynthesis radical SAM protein RaSEA [Methanobrevibacter sp. OttesenSCG-928-I08]